MSSMLINLTHCVKSCCKAETKGVSSGRMEVAYRDKKLALLETARAAETKLSVALIESFRTKLVVLKAAPDERTLRNWKSLHYEKLTGDREGQRSIRLNAQWRLIFTLETRDSPPPLLTILEIADYH